MRPLKVTALLVCIALGFVGCGLQNIFAVQGPFDQIMVKLALGIACLAFGIGLSFKTIWHGIFSDRPRWSFIVLGLLAAGSAIIYGLSNIF